MIVEDEDASIGTGCSAKEPGGGKATDPATHHDEVVSFLDRQIVNGIAFACASDLVRHLEGARMLAPQPCERRRVACRLGCDLGSRGEAGAHSEGHALEKVAAGKNPDWSPPHTGCERP